MLRKYNDLLTIVIKLETEELRQDAVIYLGTIDEYLRIVDIGHGWYRVEFTDPKPERLQGLNRRVAIFYEAYTPSNNITDMMTTYKGSNIGLLWAYKNLGFTFATYYLLANIWTYLVGIPSISTKSAPPNKWLIYGYRVCHFCIASALIYLGVYSGTLWLAIPLYFIGFTMLCSTAFAYTWMGCSTEESKTYSVAILALCMLASLVLLAIFQSILTLTILMSCWFIYLLVINPLILYINE